MSQAPATVDLSVPAGRRHLPAVLLDWFERGLIFGFYGWLVFRVLVAFSIKGAMVDLMVLVSEGLVVLLVLIRRRAVAVSLRPADWLLACSATTAPCLIQPGFGRALVPPAVGAVLMVAGMVVQIHAKLVLGCSFGCVPAHRGLKVSGPYRYVRHPMYAGYLLTHLAFLLINPTLWNLGVYVLCYSLQIPRLLAEERLLLADARYVAYTRAVRWRLVPGVF
jgi:protein-S-isoprenylcysteine O-methyltransferase Ste14